MAQLEPEYASASPFDAGTPETAPPAATARAREHWRSTRKEREAIVARIGPGRATIPVD